MDEETNFWETIKGKWCIHILRGEKKKINSIQPPNQQIEECRVKKIVKFHICETLWILHFALQQLRGNFNILFFYPLSFINCACAVDNEKIAHSRHVLNKNITQIEMSIRELKFSTTTCECQFTHRIENLNWCFRAHAGCSINSILPANVSKLEVHFSQCE